jgi:hypothetical protein
MSELGYIQWKSHTIPITHIEFHHGGAKACAEGEGPFEPYNGPADIYGTDGFLVNVRKSAIVVPRIKARERIELDLYITFDD